MEYIKAKMEHTEQIYELVQETISTIYPKYYPTEVVRFFCEHHRMDRIAADIENGYVNLLIADDCLIGTGSSVDHHITRVFIAPAYQNKGFGSYIMQRLESTIAEQYSTASLDASLPACRLYERRGYKTVRHENLALEHGAVLVYDIMEKNLHSANSPDF